MLVLFLPDYSDGNPYQHRLREALGKYNVSVNLSKSVGRLPIIRAIIKHGKPDIAHFHWTHSFCVTKNFKKSALLSCRFLFEVFILRLLGIKIVWTIHNILNHENNQKRIEILCNKMFIKFCNKFINHSSYGKFEFIKTYNLQSNIEKHITIIPHGHYIDSYENVITREQAKYSLGIKPEEVVFLFFGLIRPYKGVFQLIEAFQKLNSPNACLLIAGNVKSEAVKIDLMARCQSDKRIRIFPYFIPDKDVQLYMNAADAVVLPFQDVLTSGSALLAMSFGKALILPRRGSLTEIVDNQGGLFYDPEEKAGMYKALQQALTADFSAMGKHNYEEVKRFSWDKIAQKTYEVYSQCRF